MRAIDRLVHGLAGLYGVSGVALSAMAAHMEDGRLFGTASLMLLVHAPALLALSALTGRLRTAPGAKLLMAAGVALFAGDLVFRHYSGRGLFPMSAPSGGILMMAGWLLVAVGALIPARRTDRPSPGTAG